MASTQVATDLLSTDSMWTTEGPNATEPEPPVSNRLTGSDLVSVIIYWTTGCIGVIGNALVMIVFRHLRSKRSQANLFILNQSLADFVTSLFIITFGTTRIVRHKLSHDGASGFFLCRFWWSRFFVFSGFAVSTFNLTAMSIERYIAVVHPLKYQVFFKRRNTIIVILIVWIVGPIMQWVFPIWQYASVDGSCIFQSSWGKVHGIVVGVVLFCWEYFFPCLFMSFAYVTILRTLRIKERQVHAQVGAPDQGGGPKQDTNGNPKGPNNKNNATSKQAQARRKNVTVTLFILFIVYFVCWSPNQFTFLQFNLGGPLNFDGIWYHFTVVAAFCNTCINPFIYALKHRQFQEGLKSLFCRGKGDQKGNGSSQPGASQGGTVVD
ncbi:galanin receptor type 1-like [Lytechinus variegatus]|uniref:galanin receptor type 1-like n=1 Tax=Lytechinus variegatus TaxID=7654 RepID=UPI001BB2C97F|nr:galanin receptor type 1-like [Lytechinus variegatus]XP_041483247.1 galanin receptor type 1-like [Lytechinus variegatus]